GLYYNFQAAGEFILSQSTQPGDSFQVQIRLQPWENSSYVSVITQAAAAVGSDRVTFGVGRSNFVMVDGQSTTLSASNPTLNLAGGQLVRVSSAEYQLTWNTGEVLTVLNGGTYLNLDIAGGPADGPGSLQGLLGSDSGAADEFALPNGTVLQQPLSASELYGEFANAWRVTQATSLLDYGPGQTTATFTNTQFPAGIVPQSSLPASVLQNAQHMVTSAGITDPGLAQGATEDYLLTGDKSFIQSAAQQQNTTNTTSLVVTPPTDTLTGVGIAPAASTITEAASGPTEVAFDIYRTGPDAIAQTVNYAVLSPGAGYLGPGNFAGGVLPTGQVTIAAGQTIATLALDVIGGIGSVPSATLEVQVDTGQTGVPVLAPTASVTIGNAEPVEGNPAIPAFLDPSGAGTFTQSGTTATLDLGNIAQGNGITEIDLALVNNGDTSSDPLSGTFTVVSSDGVVINGIQSVIDLAPGGAISLPVDIDITNTGPVSETISFSGTDSNASGFTAPLGALSLTVQGDVVAAVCFLAGTLIATPCGETPVERLAVGDIVRTLRGELRPIAWIGTGRVLATRGRRNAATPVIVRRGALADDVPHRDLRVTKGHSLYLDDVLIPVEFLVNHRSILWDDRAQEVSIYHLELDTHDVLLANGAPAESYRDDGNRWLFQNRNSGWTMPPLAPCVPVLTGGPIVDALWRRLLERAGPRRSLPLTDNPDLHLLVDGRRVDPMDLCADRAVFRLPTRPHTVRICSRSAVPQELGLARDARALGVAVSRIVLAQARRQEAIEAGAASLTDGYHAFEPGNGIRWTDGDAAVSAELFANMRGSGMLIVHLAGAMEYLDDGGAAVTHVA
ncbi:MAG TPA: Hint domain-containing protein, partial [Acetobacteraceae bacterium]